MHYPNSHDLKKFFSSKDIFKYVTVRDYFFGEIPYTLCQMVLQHSSFLSDDKLCGIASTFKNKGKMCL